MAEQAAKAMPESLAEQAAKAATPMLSDQLLKQAEQLRANQLTPEDIRQLRQAAESLAKDLAPIVQSKEFQQMVEQLARQVDAEQLERIARELMSREDIRREIESAARLLMENREVKEMVAGLSELAPLAIAEQFGRESKRASDSRLRWRKQISYEWSAERSRRRTRRGGAALNNASPAR